MDLDLVFILLHACLDGRRGEFVGFELYECSGVGLISSQGIIFLFTCYINCVECVVVFLLFLLFQPPVAEVCEDVEKFQIVHRTGEMLPKFSRTGTPLGRDRYNTL